MATRITRTTRIKKEPKAPKERKVQKAAGALEAPLFDVKGAKAGRVVLPESVFGLPWNADLVHQVVVSMQSNARNTVAHTKDRGEVRGGGRKPWKQKGTGRARHGSSRSPIWVGGGITHGPRKERNFERKVNRKMRAKALFVALSKKFRDGEVAFVKDLSIKEPKSSIAKAVINALSANKELSALGRYKNAALIALPVAHTATMKSFRNFGNIEVAETRSINPVQILGKRLVLIVDPEESLKILQTRTNA